MRMERSKTLVKNMEINQRNFRKEHLAIRNAMLPGEVAEKSSAIVKRLLQSEWYKDTKEIFAYYPLGNEVDCHALFYRHGQMENGSPFQGRKRKIRWIFSILIL